MTRSIDDGLADVQIQTNAKIWVTVSRVANNLQRIEYEMQSVKSRYPDTRVRAIANDGKLIDLI